jgi:hypothetical protein
LDGFLGGGVGAAEGHALFAGGFGAGFVAEAEEHLGEEEGRLGVVGAGSGGGGKLGLGGVPLFEGDVGAGEAHAGGEILGAKGDGFFKVGDRLWVLLLFEEDVSPEIPGLFEGGFGLCGGFEERGCFGEAALAVKEEGVFEAEAGVGGEAGGGVLGEGGGLVELLGVGEGFDGEGPGLVVGGFELEDAAGEGGGFGKVAAFSVFDAHHLHEAEVVGLDGESGAPGAEGVIAAALALADDAEDVVGVEVLRVGLSGAAEERFGFREAVSVEVVEAEVEGGGEGVGRRGELLLPLALHFGAGGLEEEEGKEEGDHGRRPAPSTRVTVWLAGKGP